MNKYRRTTLDNEPKEYNLRYGGADELIMRVWFVLQSGFVLFKLLRDHVLNPLNDFVFWLNSPVSLNMEKKGF